MIDFERAVLGALLVGQGSPADFSPDDFKSPDHQTIFQEMRRQQGPVSSIGVVASLSHRDQNGHRWANLVAGLMDAAPAPANFQTAIEYFRRGNRHSALRQAALELTTLLEEAPTDHELHAATCRIEEIARPSGRRAPRPVAAGLAEVFTQAAQPHVPLGIGRLADFRIVPGNLTVVAARPGVGKTAMLGTIALGAAKHGWRALIVSLEMSGLEIRQRLLAGYAEIALGSIQAGDNPRLATEAAALAKLPIWLEDESDARLDLESIADLIRGFAATNSVILIDYLQLITTRAKYEKRYELIGHVCRELKHLAVANSVPIIVAAQLSRAAEQHAGKPQLSDLRESGEIEQTADKVLLIHRDGDECALRIAKYRQGPTFNCSVRYVADQCRFGDPEDF